MRISHQVSASCIEIEVSGKEKTKMKFKETYHETNSEGQMEMKHRNVKLHAKKNIFHFKSPAVIFPGSLSPGDASIPFGFMLPVGLPSSFFFKQGHHNLKPEAKIKYHIKATLKDAEGHKVTSYKQVLIVREAIPQGQENISSHSEF
jgi:hypothetical protein